MSYTIKSMPCNPKNRGGKKTDNNEFIVVHWTANKNDKAESNGKYFTNVLARPASANYFVDENVIVRSVEDNYIAYAVGGAKYRGTKGAKYYGTCKNANSISIELCPDFKDVTYFFTEATLENAADLTKDLMKKYDIDIDHVIRHYDVTGKDCPGIFVDSDAAWTDFKERIVPLQMITPESTKTQILRLQKALNKVDLKIPKLKEDGDYGAATGNYVVALWKHLGFDFDKDNKGMKAGRNTLRSLRLI